MQKQQNKRRFERRFSFRFASLRAVHRLFLLGFLFFCSSEFVGCALFSLTYPSESLEEPPAPMVASDSRAPLQSVSISFDEKGIPSIFARTDVDASYALGVLHARDRLFQLDVMRHAARGKLTELLGDEFVEVDRQLRLLSWHLDEQVKALSKEDQSLMNAYVLGVNDGAQEAGRSAEMHILGQGFLPFTVSDVVAIGRLHAWERSFGLEQELVHARILARMPKDDVRREAILRPVSSKGASVLAPHLVYKEKEKDGGIVDAHEKKPNANESFLKKEEDVSKTRWQVKMRKRSQGMRKEMRIRRLLAHLGLEMGAGSNAFVVDGSLTESHKPVLVADPHLRHTSPSAFYTVRMHIGDEVHVAGVTRAGLPMILMGATEHMAWALTSSWMDTIDLVRIDRVVGKPSLYRLDEQNKIFERQTHRYLSQGQVILTEQNLSTSLGPILPAGYAHLQEPSETFAVLWTGFDAVANAKNISSMWQLLRVKTLTAASETAAQIGAPAENMLMAFTSGDIAYRLMGQLPRRRSGISSSAPRSARTSNAAWDGFLDAKDRPQLDNPPWHFIVNANQRVAPDGYPTVEWLGRNGDLAHRAQRLQMRLSQLVGRPNGDALLSLQMDVTSMQAIDLSAALGRACPEKLAGFDEKRVFAFCDGLRNFDGAFWRNSLGALVYSRVIDALFEEVLAVHLGPDIGRQLLLDPGVVSALERAVLLEDAGETSPLFDDRRTSVREGLAGFMQKATVAALDRLEDEVGKEPRDWQWGKVHFLEVNGLLLDNPLVGWTFSGRPTQQDGHGTAVRAESGTPISRGAALRMLAEMKGPTEISLVLDLGESGHRFSEHERDQFGEWNSALPISRRVTADDARVEVKSRMLLVPAPVEY